MPVRRRPDRDNQWQIDFRVRGHRFRELHPAGLAKREVEALERQRRQEIEAATIGARDTWCAIAARYWAEHARHLAWQNSVRGHLTALSDAIGDHTPISRISADTFARAIARWREKLAPSTINHRLGVARGLWKLANEVWGLPMPVIPWRRLAQPLPDRIPPYVAPAERAAVMRHAPEHVRLAIRLALATGWRRASVLGMRWEHIDWTRGTITGLGKGRVGGKILIHPLTDEIRAILAAVGVQETGPVVRYQGQAIADVKVAFNRARAVAGVPHVKFRDLRHSVAQEILASTDSLEAVQAVLDHDRLSTTAKHYARFQLAQKERALRARGWSPDGHQPQKSEANPNVQPIKRQPIQPALASECQENQRVARMRPSKKRQDIA